MCVLLLPYPKVIAVPVVPPSQIVPKDILVYVPEVSLFARISVSVVISGSKEDTVAVVKINPVVWLDPEYLYSKTTL
jgi:hypothetical protein